MTNPPEWAPLPAPPQVGPMPYYAPPPPQTPQKPSSGYKALGIIMLCLGVAGVLWALVSAVMVAFVSSAKSSPIYDFETLVFTYGRLVMSIVTGAMLAAAGFGVFAERNGRVCSASRTRPCRSRRLGSAGRSTRSSFNRGRWLTWAAAMKSLETFTYVTLAFGVIVSSALPIVVLVALLRAGAKQELDA